jgi:hypothetical protein
VRWRLAGALFVALSLAACSKGSSSQPSPQSSSTSSPAAVDFKAAASALVDDLAAGKFNEVESKFDTTMKGQLPVAQLQNNWRTYLELVGSYKSHAAPEQVMKGEIAVERVTITTSSGTGEVRVSYHPDGTIAGLFFLKAGAPPP